MGNGAKMWITNGTIDGNGTGDCYLVYARTGEKKSEITLFLAEKGMPGFSLGQKIHDKCGMRASMTAELVFQDVRRYAMAESIPQHDRGLAPTIFILPLEGFPCNGVKSYWCGFDFQSDGGASSFARDGPRFCRSRSRASGE